MVKFSERTYYEEWRSLRSAVAKCKRAVMAIGYANHNLPIEYEESLKKEQYLLIDCANRLEIKASEIINHNKH